MIIRDEQIEAIGRNARESLIDQLVAHLQRVYASAVAGIPDDLLRLRVAYGIERAERWGLAAPRNLASFVFLMFLVCPHFDESRRVRRILANGPASPGARMPFLLARMSDADWNEVRRTTRETSWPDHLREVKR